MKTVIKECAKFVGGIVAFGFFMYFFVAFFVWLINDPLDIVPTAPAEIRLDLCAYQTDDDSEPCADEAGNVYRNGPEYWNAKKTETK